MSNLIYNIPMHGYIKSRKFTVIWYPFAINKYKYNYIYTTMKHECKLVQVETKK